METFDGMFDGRSKRRQLSVVDLNFEIPYIQMFNYLNSSKK